MEVYKRKSEDSVDKGESTAYRPSYPMRLENEQQERKGLITVHYNISFIE